jgi:hypothetical protein
VRGSVGTLIGGVLGAMVGGGIAVAIVTHKASITEPIETLKSTQMAGLVGTGVTVVSALTGLFIGARAPEC